MGMKTLDVHKVLRNALKLLQSCETATWRCERGGYDGHKMSNPPIIKESCSLGFVNFPIRAT